MSNIEIDTVPAVVARRADEAPDQLVVMANQRGKWGTTTARQLAERVASLAKALADGGLVDGDRVAVIVKPSPDFLVVDLAVQAAGGVSATVPPTDDDEALAALLRPLAPAMAIVDDAVAADRIRGLVDAGRLDPIARVVARGRGSSDQVGLDDLEELGSGALDAGPSAWLRQHPDGPSTITYTAGSGGTPRPIVHAGRAVADAARAVASSLELAWDDVTVVGFHPSHPTDRAVTLYPALVSGAVLAYPEDDSTFDLAVREVQPTFGHFPVERLRDAASSVRGRFRRNRGVKRLVARWWRTAAYEPVAAGGAPSSLVHRVVGMPALRALGWRELRTILVTGRAVPNDVLVTLTSLGAPIRSGYAFVEGGLVAMGDARERDSLAVLDGVTITESDGRLVVARDELALGSIDGAPLPTVGSGVLTGDLGAVADGRVRVDGPEASVVALADGRRVVAASIERELRDSPYIAGAVVQSVDGGLSAEVLVDAGSVGDWATERRLPFTTFASLVALDEVRGLIADEVAAAAPDVVRHDLLKRPLQQGRDITRTGQTIHGGPKRVAADPASTATSEPASAVD